MKKRHMGLFINAWIFEICAASAAIAIGVIQTFFNAGTKVDWTGGAMASATITAITFIMIALAELTKIPFAIAFLETDSKRWKTLFGIVVASIVFLTFETINSGLDIAYDFRNRAVTELSIEIESNENEIVKLKNDKMNTQSITQASIDAWYKNSSKAVNDKHNLLLVDINNAKSAANGTLTIQTDRKTKSLRQQIADIEKKQQSVITANAVKVKTLTMQLEIGNKTLQATIASLKDCSFCGPEESAKAAAEANINDIQADIKRINAIKPTGGAEIKVLRKKIAKVAAAVAKSAGPTKDFSADREKIRVERKKDIDVLDTKKAKDLATLAKAEITVADLEKQISILVTAVNKTTAVKSKKAQSDIIHRFAKSFEWALGKPKNEAEFNNHKSIVKRVWFGSISLIVAIVGPMLAFAHLILNRAPAPARKPWFRSLAAAIKMKKRKETIVEVEVDKIVEVPVEVEVEKIVEVEVPVNNVVIQEVEVVREVEVERIVLSEVEVPVEKVVVTQVEVPVEVIKTQVEYMPIYTNDSELLKTSLAYSKDVK